MARLLATRANVLQKEYRGKANLKNDLKRMVEEVFGQTA